MPYLHGDDAPKFGCSVTDQEARLRDALAAALDRYGERVGSPFPADVRLEVVESDAFFAQVSMASKAVMVDVSTGVVDRIDAVWNSALEISAGLPEGKRIDLLGNPSHTADMSLRWLMQHELNHYANGHFSLTGGAALLEAGSDTVYGLVSHATPVNTPLAELTGEELALAPLCLELQTDHDSTEIVLGAYSSENWVLFRYYATCIMVVILIIEHEERSCGGENRTHPWAATRLFMLLGHLVELPYIPAIKRAHHEGLESIPANYYPPESEIKRYQSEVVSRVLGRSQIFAEVIGLQNLWHDLAGYDALFEDIRRAMIGDTDDHRAFKTRGAQQWAELKPLNIRLLQMIRPIGLPE